MDHAWSQLGSLAAVVAGVLAVAWRWRRRGGRALPATFAIAGVVIAAYAFTRPPGLLSGDEGIKLVQAQALAAGRLDLPYPGEVLDRQRVLFPFSAPFVIRRGPAHYGVYPTTFVAPAALAWRTLGWWGLYLLPVGGALLALASTLRLARRVLGDDRWAAACGAALLVTPLAINAAVFNEHALATGLVLAALLVLVEPAARRGAIAAAGLALGAAVVLRPELLGAAPALAAFTVVRAPDIRAGARRVLLLGVAAAAPVGAQVAVHLATIGRLAPQLDPSYVAKLPPTGWDGLYPHDQFTVTGVGGVVALWLPALGLLAALRGRAGQLRLAVIVGVMAAWLVAGVIYLVRAPDPTHAAGALWAGTPLALLGLACGPAPAAGPAPGPAHGPDHPLAGALWALAAGALAGIYLLYPVAGGLRLGPRFLLPVIPLCVILAAAAVQRARVLALVAVPAALLGAAYQVVNHDLLMRIKGRNAALVAELARRPATVVVTDTFWGAQVTAPVYPDKLMFAAPRFSPAWLAGIAPLGHPEVIELIGGLRALPGLDPLPLAPGETGKVRTFRIRQVPPRR